MCKAPQPARLRCEGLKRIVNIAYRIDCRLAMTAPISRFYKGWDQYNDLLHGGEISLTLGVHGLPGLGQ
jgi:hypothetical protein